jgi:DNA repair exonuclease SbcCD ATPase subunit
MASTAESPYCLSVHGLRFHRLQHRWLSKTLWFVRLLAHSHQLNKTNNRAWQLTDMDRTLKLRTFSDTAKSPAAKEKSAKERNIAQELEKKTAHLEEERIKSLDLVKTIVQLRESLKQEQEKSSVLEARVNKLDSVEENQLIRKNTELEEEKKRSLEFVKTIKQLRESLKLEQEKSAQMTGRMAELETKVYKLDAVEASQLVKKNAQLEEEKKKSLEYEKTIEQLRENLKQELGKSADTLNRMAELKSKVDKMDSVEDNQLIKKNTLLEEEKKKTLDYAKLVDQLRESIKENQEQIAGKVKRIAKLEAKIEELTGILGKIAGISTAGKLDLNV